jgi:hypothetical protein
MVRRSVRSARELRGRALALVFVVTLAAALVPLRVAADEPESAASVTLRLEGEWPSELREDVVLGFTAEARGRGIDVTLDTARGEAPPELEEPTLATITITAPSIAAPASTITVRDRLTRKLVERVVPLGGEPLDVWSVLLASAADELLRASWVELSMPDAPPPSVEPPEVVREVVARSVDPPLPSDGAWGIDVEAELVAGEGGLFVGGRAGLAQASLDPVVLSVSLAALGLVPQVSERARFEGAWLAGDLEARVALVPRRGEARLALVAVARVGALLVSASAADGLVGGSDVIPTVLVLGGLRGGLGLSRGTQLTLGLLVGAPALGAVASDGVRDVASISGPTVLLDVGVELWP